MKIIVLSLDTEIGINRRKRLNYNYEMFKGTDNLDDVPEWIKNNMKRNKSSDNIFKGKCCHFYSYYKILKKIVDEKLDNIIVCEDDALLVHLGFLSYGGDPNLDSPVLLNGKLHHPTSWKYNTKKYFNENILTEIYKFKTGYNNINYEKFRWTTTACIYYPNYKIVENIINLCENYKKKYTYFDIWMCNNKLVKYLYYPSIFKIDDNNISQINTHNNGILYNYKIN